MDNVSELCGVNHYAMPIQIISYSLKNSLKQFVTNF